MNTPVHLKSLTPAGVEHALERADYFRLLNEPAQAESACLDILAADPKNQRALVILILALTDQFGLGTPISDPDIADIIRQVTDEYQKIFLSALVLERRARAKLEQQIPQAESMAYDLCNQAMALYEKAELIRAVGNDDVLLRWNACARMIMQHNLEARHDDESEQPLE